MLQRKCVEATDKLLDRNWKLNAGDKLRNAAIFYARTNVNSNDVLDAFNLSKTFFVFPLVIVVEEIMLCIVNHQQGEISQFKQNEHMNLLNFHSICVMFFHSWIL